ncbi:hypothetical protein L2719_15985 [Shewanella schlegeliana]|uniref:Uncharacterized protein n=1 Tax=Shewanella schlegeliana TaxID=190308 RepID=A0ABS1T2T1_9GAMM|nr:hypothetical protein [Shewanella schlegeliana]MBL4915101.1 hypothetical protein [Shewanella schlegeliana]MCL1111033.1 hypothetical protein [Shewanella schlegeliana]GIU29117.1 hypothetical protein TUM4433_18010 [Shewanella schlegeliana]
MFAKINFAIIALGASALSFNSQAGEAEDAFVGELADCAAYYHIASDAISAMDAPQMAAVVERLKLSGKQAAELAKQFQTEEQVSAAITTAAEKHRAAMPNAKSLGPLMGKYKETCKSILAEPEKRLEYWTMVTM